MRCVVFATALVGLALISTACAGAGSPSPTSPPTTPLPVSAGSPAASPASQTGPVRSLSPEPGGQAQQNVVDEVVRQAAAYANVAATDVAVQQVEEREWSDSSLGCPRPDQMYLQVITPGYLVVVRAGTRVLEYHSDARGRVVLCQER